MTVAHICWYKRCVAQAHAASDEGHLDEELYGVTMRMTKLGLQPTKRMHSLGMEAALRANNLEVSSCLPPGMRCSLVQSPAARHRIITVSALGSCCKLWPECVYACG